MEPAPTPRTRPPIQEPRCSSHAPWAARILGAKGQRAALQSAKLAREPGDRPLSHTGTFLPRGAHAETRITADQTGRRAMNLPAESRAASSAIPLWTDAASSGLTDACASERELLSGLGPAGGVRPRPASPCPAAPRAAQEGLPSAFTVCGPGPCSSERGGGALWPRLIRPRSRRTPAAPGAAVPPLRLAALGHRASADRCRTRPLVQPAEVCCVCELPVAAGTNCHRTGGFKQHTRLSSHGSAGQKCKQGSWG